MQVRPIIQSLLGDRNQERDEQALAMLHPIIPSQSVLPNETDVAEQRVEAVEAVAPFIERLLGDRSQELNEQALVISNPAVVTIPSNLPTQSLLSYGTNVAEQQVDGTCSPPPMSKSPAGKRSRPKKRAGRKPAAKSKKQLFKSHGQLFD